MKLLIICMSFFLLALTPAKQANKMADKYNSERITRQLKKVDEQIKDLASGGYYYTYYCAFFPATDNQDIHKFILVLKKNGYKITALNQEQPQCSGESVFYMKIEWQ